MTEITEEIRESEDKEIKESKSEEENYNWRSYFLRTFLANH